MAWIESHQQLARHPKTKLLARVLGVSRVLVIGHLHLLWWWALDYAQDGDLSRHSVETIADGAEWEGDAGQFVDALIQVGFLDKNEDVLLLHDWQQYAGRLIEKREANAQRQRRCREQHEIPIVSHPSVTRDSTVTDAHVTVSHGATKPNQTKPNHEYTSQGVATEAPVKPLTRLFAPEDIEYRLTGRLRDWILTHDPKAKVPAVGTGPFQAWCRHADLLIRVDGRDPPEIERVIDWCQKDSFWHRNILSTRTLREKFTRLFLAMNSEKTNQGTPSSNIRPKPRLEVYDDGERSELYDPAKHGF